MHDPMTVAFEIRYPWLKWGKLGRDEWHRTYREPFITIWHVDPEHGGSDDSCDWHGSNRPLNAREKALRQAVEDLLHRLGNAPYYPDPHLYGTAPHSDEEGADTGPVGALRLAMYEWRKRSRFRLPVRWHIWHWRLQIHPVQHFKRWAFSRCCKCGGRFRWGTAPCSNSWHGDGPRWFRGERGVYHGNCETRGENVAAVAS